MRLEFPCFDAVLAKLRRERAVARAAALHRDAPRDVDMLAKLQPIILDGGARAEAALRLVLALMWSDPRDFDGFLLDSYPAIFRQVTNAMSLDHKFGLLLKAESVQGAWAKLSRAHGVTLRATLEQHAHVIAQRVGLSGERGARA